ncbi:8280_t:CDS:2 [Paraglomus brasilianum]|uniref:Peptide-methionine (R)-S-oxide reductase n=1 Tax=Paraglomus brasilianum TaxID=144538 RepID=A0A9N9F6G3_9GLOM|nr:8280_t:CDS:2 [Paraglomus brasilianum]
MSQTTNNNQTQSTVQKTEEEWRQELSPERYHILREKGTEIAGTGKYEKHKATGTYLCGACDAELYKSEHKFSSGCGWPAFYDALPNAVSRNVDKSHGMSRTEITCSNCGGHLGHVFQGEGWKFTAADERHCVNSLSLKFQKPDGTVDNSV